MDEFEWLPNLDLLEIFPRHISDDMSLIYHGTSTIYSNDIEANGLTNSYSPIPITDLQIIINLLERLGQPSDFDPNSFQFKFNYAGVIEHYLHYLGNHPISFTAHDFAAVQYASGNSKGGQIVGKIKGALSFIRESIDQLPVDNADRVLLNNDFERVANVVNRCEEIEQGEGVVYAIRPSIEQLAHFKVDHNVIFSSGPIQHENLIAKIRIPANYVLEDEVACQIKGEVKKRLHKPGSIGHTLIVKTFQNDDN